MKMTLQKMIKTTALTVLTKISSYNNKKEAVKELERKSIKRRRKRLIKIKRDMDILLVYIQGFLWAMD